MIRSPNDPVYSITSNFFNAWTEDLLSRQPPTLYSVSTTFPELNRFEIGPGLVTLIGGPPGAGKTAFVMQCVIDALRIKTDLRALVCNVEMTPQVLMDRQLARLSGIDATTVRMRSFRDEHQERMETGLLAINQIAPRLAFLNPPYTLGCVAEAAEDFQANVVVLDYIQRITPPGQFKDNRATVNATMNYVRRLADFGLAVVVVAAVSRTKDKAGRSSYDSDGLGLASYRETSELEFGADNAWILTAKDAQSSMMTLKHLKARHGEQIDLALRFNKSVQSFVAPDQALSRRQPTPIVSGKSDHLIPSRSAPPPKENGA
jgi:replicative DNA helicase